jgi:hypothetical protein
MTPIHVRRYRFHGLSLEISGNQPRLLGMAHSRFQRSAVADGGPADLTVSLHCVSGSGVHGVERPVTRARPVYELPEGEVLYFGAEDRLYVELGGRVRGLCAPSERSIRISVTSTEERDFWAAAHPLLTLLLIELFKRLGRYSLHAAGFSVAGRGLLLPGRSGSGKSTLAVALMREGFGLLGDDMLFLQPDAAGDRVLGFPDELGLADETVSFFPELHSLLEAEKPPGRPKRAARPEAVFPVELVWESRPVVLVFPRVARRERSVLRPLTPDAALLELAPNVLLTEARSSQSHLDSLAALAGRCRSYALETGRDFHSLPALFRTLLH